MIGITIEEAGFALSVEFDDPVEAVKLYTSIIKLETDDKKYFSAEDLKLSYSMSMQHHNKFVHVVEIDVTDVPPSFIQGLLKTLEEDNEDFVRSPYVNLLEGSLYLDIWTSKESEADRLSDYLYDLADEWAVEIRRLDIFYDRGDGEPNDSNSANVEVSYKCEITPMAGCVVQYIQKYVSQHYD